MTPIPIDAAILTTALDAWERNPTSYDVTPFHALSLAHPTEASYVWQLARGALPPAQLVGEAIQNLLAWGLVDHAGALTPLARRLIEAGRTKATTAAMQSVPRQERSRAPARAASGEAGRLSDRALHLLREIAAGRHRIFAMDERPPGWTAIERLGLATRAERDGARLTPDGEEFVRGVEAGQGEVLDDGWTRETAEQYLAQIGAPSSVFDAGHQAGIRAAVGLNRPSTKARASSSSVPRAIRTPSPASAARASSSQARTGAHRAAGAAARLTPAKVLADLKKATGLPASLFTRRDRRSGLTVRKETPSVVYVAYDDYGDRGNQPAIWPTILTALERAGYALRMADGSIGADARAKALRNGAVLVSRPSSRAGATASEVPQAPSSRAAKKVSGDWAWTADAQVFIPDERVTPLPTDEWLPLRGYGWVQAIRRDGKIIGWAEIP